MKEGKDEGVGESGRLTEELYKDCKQTVCVYTRLFASRVSLMD